MRKLGATLIIIGLVCLLYTEGVLLRTLAYIGIDIEPPVWNYENAQPFPCVQYADEYLPESVPFLVFRENESITFSCSVQDNLSGLSKVEFFIEKNYLNNTTKRLENFTYYFNGETSPQTFTFTRRFSYEENLYYIDVLGIAYDRAGNEYCIQWWIYPVKDYPRFVVMVENTIIESNRCYWFSKENLRITIHCLTPEIVRNLYDFYIKFYIDGNLVLKERGETVTFYHVFEKNKLHRVALTYDLDPVKKNIVALVFNIGEPEKETSYDIWSYVPIMSVGLMLLGLLLLAKPVKK